MKINVPYFRQDKSTTCGVACLRMILSFNGIAKSESKLEYKCDTSWLGNTCEELAECVKAYNCKVEVFENMAESNLIDFLEKGQPIIVLVDPAVIYGGLQGFGHFFVVIGYDDDFFHYHDPDLSADLKIKKKLFGKAWAGQSNKGIKVWKSMKK